MFFGTYGAAGLKSVDISILNGRVEDMLRSRE